MADDQLICPACGKAYQATPEYLIENAGLEMDCECGQAIAIPRAEQIQAPPTETASPTLLSYAAPEFPPKPIRGVWRDELYVVVARGSRLPNRCCVCNEPTMGTIPTRILSWTPSHARRHLRTPVGGLLNAAIAESYSQSIVVRVGRCPKHRLEFKPVTVALTLLALSIASFIGCVMFVEKDIPALAGAATVLVLFIAAMIVWRIKPRVHAVNFQGNFAWLTGFGDSYLESLPPYAEMVEATRQDLATSLEQLQDAELEMDRESEQAIAIPSETSEETEPDAMPTDPQIQGFWNDYSYVVLARGSRLPNRCCLCNEPIAQELPARTLMWAPRNTGSELRGVVGKLIGGAIAASYSQSIVVRVGRCPNHRREFNPKRTSIILLAAAIACFLATACFLHGDTASQYGAYAVGIFIFASAIVWRIPGRVKVNRFQGNLAWIEGFGDAYVESLPRYKQMVAAEARKTAQALEEMQ